jgi:hypothetical protein
MKKLSLIFVAFSLLAAAGPLAAQSSPATPAPQPPATPASQPPERRATTLNLDLDEASRRQIMSGPRDPAAEQGAGRGAASGLPTLGGDARAQDRTLRASPFPKDAQTDQNIR